MVAAIGTFPAVLWSLALAGFFLVVIPVVIMLGNRVVSALREIRAYASDILVHGVRLAENLDPVEELPTTRDLVKQVGDGLARYGGALDGLLSRRRLP